MSSEPKPLHHTYYLTQHQNEMKFIAFFAFVATAIATTQINYYTVSDCKSLSGSGSFTLFDCGCINLANDANHAIVSARMKSDDQSVTWYEGENCGGNDLLMIDDGSCVGIPFIPHSILIKC